MYYKKNELYHHGILGQKWGVRRYQNEDGSLTTAGKSRYKKSTSMSEDELEDAIKKMNLQKSYDNLMKEQQKNSTLNKTKKVVDTSSILVDQARRLNYETVNNSKTKETLDLSSMTDKEIIDKMNRYNLERQYNDMFAKETTNISKGKQYISDILEASGNVLALGSSALAVALAIKELRS